MDGFCRRRRVKQEYPGSQNLEVYKSEKLAVWGVELMTNVRNGCLKGSFGQASTQLLPIRNRAFLYESRKHLTYLD